MVLASPSLPACLPAMATSVVHRPSNADVTAMLRTAIEADLHNIQGGLEAAGQAVAHEGLLESHGGSGEGGREGQRGLDGGHCSRCARWVNRLNRGQEQRPEQEGSRLLWRGENNLGGSQKVESVSWCPTP